MRNTTQNKISSNLLFFINPDRTKNNSSNPSYYSRINDCRTEMGTEIGKKVIEKLKENGFRKLAI
jgi:hypothetical protein